MSFSEIDYTNLTQRVERYKSTLQNTTDYRAAWAAGLKTSIVEMLENAIATTGMPATIELRSEIANLEAIVVNLGMTESGLSETVSDKIQRPLIKQNGSLVYQQLFNGKILTLINYPFIEKYGQPQPPKTIAIYRPEELKPPYILRHLETLFTEIIAWEDYDDDAPEPNQRIGFKMNFTEEAK
jgi:hypothetical protein